MAKVMSNHWMVFVDWSTVARWKSGVKAAEARGETHPYQYSSNNARFRKIKPKDVLWIVSTPRFAVRGKATLSGRARPPAVMARLRVKNVCCNRPIELERIKKKNKKTGRYYEPVCLGSKLPCCDEAGLDPASDAWSIVAIGEKDPKSAKDPMDPKPFLVTYPVLYNFFGILHRLCFETKHGRTHLLRYLEFVEGGQYLTRTQRQAKREGKDVRDPGPYAAFGQFLQTLRRLTPDAAGEMDRFHKHAVEGKRIFFSYKWDDVQRFSLEFGQTRREWVKELNRKLEMAGYSSWLDHHQILADRDIGDLLEEVLADAVHQSVVFVALLSENYGTGWTLEEWRRACAQIANEKRQYKLQRIVLNCGGDPQRLGLIDGDAVAIPYSPTPDNIVDAIKSVQRPT